MGAQFVRNGLGEEGHIVDYANNGRDGLFSLPVGVDKNRRGGEIAIPPVPVGGA
jgi:hypothetical protein